MIKPINDWPEPQCSGPAETPELPSNVFYAIVCDDDTLVKACRRRSFTSYVQVVPAPKIKTPDVVYISGNTPTLFNTKKEAETNRQNALDALDIRTSESVQLRLQAFRIVESDWNSHWDAGVEDVCAFRDARRMATGVLHYNTVAKQIKKLAGRVLTVIDAAYVNENQNKAVKDLTKSSFRAQLNELWDKSREDPDCNSAEGVYEKDILDD